MRYGGRDVPFGDRVRHIQRFPGRALHPRRPHLATGRCCSAPSQRGESRRGAQAAAGDPLPPWTRRPQDPAAANRGRGHHRSMRRGRQGSPARSCRPAAGTGDGGALLRLHGCGSRLRSRCGDPPLVSAGTGDPASATVLAEVVAGGGDRGRRGARTMQQRLLHGRRHCARKQGKGGRVVVRIRRWPRAPCSSLPAAVALPTPWT
jgi:hypothetical protein